MSSSPQFIGIDTGAVKEATKNNYKQKTSASFDDKLYSASSSMSYLFGPAISSAVATAKGEDSSSGMIVDAAINASASGDAGLSTSLSSGSMSYLTGGGSSSLSTNLGSSSAYTYDPYATSASGSDAFDTSGSEQVAEAGYSYSDLIATQMSMNKLTTQVTLVTTVLKSKHDTLMNIARNA